jgi:hypothetical protein
MMSHARLALLITFVLLPGVTGMPATAVMADTKSTHLQCNGETRSHLLAFVAGDIRTEALRDAERRIRIEIRHGKRASVLDMPSGEVLFAASQCRVSAMRLTCETSDDGHHRQMFISRTSGDAVFEGYTQTSDEKSALVVERYRCLKEDREPLF